MPPGAQLSALEAYVRRLSGRVLRRIIYTDSLLRLVKNKERRIMRRAFRTGQRIARAR